MVDESPIFAILDKVATKIMDGRKAMIKGDLSSAIYKLSEACNTLDQTSKSFVGKDRFGLAYHAALIAFECGDYRKVAQILGDQPVLLLHGNVAAMDLHTEANRRTSKEWVAVARAKMKALLTAKEHQKCLDYISANIPCLDVTEVANARIECCRALGQTEAVKAFQADLEWLKNG